MKRITMNINDFKDAFTYESEDEPDIYWLESQFNVNITTNDSVAVIEGEEDDIITMYHQHHLEDYVSVRLTEDFNFEHDDFPVCDPTDDDNDYWENLYQRMYSND